MQKPNRRRLCWNTSDSIAPDNELRDSCQIQNWINPWFVRWSKKRANH